MIVFMVCQKVKGRCSPDMGQIIDMYLNTNSLEGFKDKYF